MLSLPSHVSDLYAPSTLICRLTVLYGPLDKTGGGSEELLPLLTLPSSTSETPPHFKGLVI